MAIDQRWTNWATSITSAVLLVFALAQLVISFYMNLTASTNKAEKTNISGAMLVSLGVLFFPTAWVGFAAAISRHRGVYIAMIVLVALTMLDAIGMLVYQAYRFSETSGYTDDEKGIAITMTVIESLLIIILIFDLAFVTVALCYRNPEHSRHGRKSEKYGYPMAYSQPPPVYNGGERYLQAGGERYLQAGGERYLQAGEGYRMSLPRGAWDYATEPRYLKSRY